MNNEEVKIGEENVVNGFSVDCKPKYLYEVDQHRDEVLKSLTKRKSKDSSVDPRQSVFLKMKNAGIDRTEII